VLCLQEVIARDPNISCAETYFKATGARVEKTYILTLGGTEQKYGEQSLLCGILLLTLSKLPAPLR